VPRITISYRRDDSGVITGRIFDRLSAHYGRDSVFRDIDNIPPGVDFRKHIDGVLDESDVVLAIIGPQWIGPRRRQNRIADIADPVRVEIETALRKEKPLVPVLVLRAAMPRLEQLPESLQDITFLNAAEIDDGRDFDTHIGRLITWMDQFLGEVSARGCSDRSGMVEVEAAESDTHKEFKRQSPPAFVHTDPRKNNNEKVTGLGGSVRYSIDTLKKHRRRVVGLPAILAGCLLLVLIMGTISLWNTFSSSSDEGEALYRASMYYNMPEHWDQAKANALICAAAKMGYYPAQADLKTRTNPALCVKK
jgi:hypothetical protein